MCDTSFSHKLPSHKIDSMKNLAGHCLNAVVRGRVFAVCLLHLHSYFGSKVDTRTLPSMEPVKHILQSMVEDQSTLVTGVRCPPSPSTFIKPRSLSNCTRNNKQILTRDTCLGMVVLPQVSIHI